MNDLKTSGKDMQAGREALENAAQNIESARAELEAAYGRLQKQWQSSEARARADKEYQQLVESLRSSVGWARSTARLTADVDGMFARLERDGMR